MKKRSYVSKLEVDDDGELAFLIPQELFKELKLNSDDILEWTIEGDKVYFAKTGFKSNI